MDKFVFDEAMSSAKTGQQDTVGSLLTKGGMVDGIDSATARHEDEAKRNPNGSTAEKADKKQFVGEKDIVKLTDICNIQYGYAFDSKCFSDDASLIPLVRIRDVKRGYSETFYSGEYSEEYIVRKNDLLVGMDGEFNIARWKSNDSLLNQRVCRIITSAGIDEEYLRYALTRKLKAIEDRTAFVTVKHLSAKEINAMELALPPISVQTEISGVLSKIESIIEKKKSQIEELDTLIKARFIEMFGDSVINPLGLPTVLLSEVSDIVSGITKGRKTNGAELFEVPYMAVSNVKAGYIDWSTVKSIKATEDEIEQYRLQPLDVLMTEGGDPDKLGRGAIINEPPENCIHQNHIFRVRVNRECLLPQYLEEYLQHQKAKQYFLGCAKQTTGIASINMKQLRAMPVLLPEMKLQEQFATFVQQTDKSKSAIQKSLNELQTLFDSLMQEYFG